MRTMVAALLCVVLMPVCCWATATEGERTKEFPEYRCRLTLPGPGYQWLDHTKIQAGVAFFANASDTIRLLMLVEENRIGAVINERFMKEYDYGFTRSGGVTKLSGRIRRFRGVPCYELHARLEGSSSPGTIRVFAANGYMFQLQLIGSDLPVDERDKLEPIFSAFEFIGEPEVPVLEGGGQDKGIGGSTAKYKYIAIVAAAALAAIILVIRDAARRRKERRSSG